MAYYEQIRNLLRATLGQKKVGLQVATNKEFHIWQSFLKNIFGKKKAPSRATKENNNLVFILVIHVCANILSCSISSFKKKYYVGILY